MKKIYFTCALLLLGICVSAQSLTPQVLASSGDYFTSTNIKLNWTLGEMVTETFITSGNILTQGFQQPNYLYSSLFETDENKEITIYPNPFSDIININTGDYTDLYLQVLDFQGKNLMRKNIKKSNLQIDFSTLSPGIYFIKIYSDKKDLKTFKVQKIKN